jgi:PadR family transcriptional regulator, regulatory protein PadR
MRTYNVGNMAQNQNLGEFEQIVLLAILRLSDQAYGVTIRQEIRKHTGRNTVPGALYTTLDRLEQKGLVASRLGEPTPERGGRAKRYYDVTAAGVAAVERAQRSFQSLLHGLQLLGKKHA